MSREELRDLSIEELREQIKFTAAAIKRAPSAHMREVIALQNQRLWEEFFRRGKLGRPSSAEKRDQAEMVAALVGSGAELKAALLTVAGDPKRVPALARYYHRMMKKLTDKSPP